MTRVRSQPIGRIGHATSDHGTFHLTHLQSILDAFAMGYDYDKLYAAAPDALGAPTSIFVEFFAKANLPLHASVLDVGCGQGRDALFIAKRGHQVTGIDLSPHGIADLRAAAASQGLNIEGIVADLREYTPPCAYDVILIDRTLHMLDRECRLDALKRLLCHIKRSGWLLIADERSNIADFKSIIAQSPHTWKTHTEKQGY